MTAEFSSQLNAAVVGAGAWGTALAQHLAGAGHQVRLWAYEPEVASEINRAHVNSRYLPETPLNPALTATNSLGEALSGADLAVTVVPSHLVRRIVGQAAEHLAPDTILVSCSKGIEDVTGYTMCEVVEDVLPKAYHRRISALSGPSFAREVATGVPTAVTIASREPEVAETAQLAFATPLMRVYTSPDVVGVELGGAVKNPLAIAAGMVAGLKLGHNTLSALITRGLAEMTRLAQARGGQLVTCAGLAGLGDLVLTCTSPQSRNYTVGLRLAAGERIEDILAGMSAVAEGVKNTRTVLALAKRSRVDMPIIAAVDRVLHHGQSPVQALHELMSRDLKSETY